MDYIQLLRDTPLPTILVIGGIFFLLLSVLQKAGTQIETKPGKDRFAIITGFVLLLSGVSLYLVPPTQPTTPTATPTNSVVSAVTLLPPTEVIYELPTANDANPNANPTATTISSLSTQPQSSGICKEEGGASGFPLPPTPAAPTNSCVLIVEWWVPPDSANCGILITTKEPILPEGSIGSWFYVVPQRPDSHIQEFLAKNPNCKVDDQR